MKVWLAVALLVAPSAKRDTDREIRRQRQELDAIRGRLEEEQRELSTHKAKKSATLEELEKLSGNIALAGQYLKKMGALEGELSKASDEARRDLDRVEARLDARGKALARRVRLLFMSGRPENLLWAPAAEEGDFFRRAYWVKRLVRHDRSLVEQSRRDMGLKRLALEKLLARRQELETFQNRKREEMGRFTRAKSDQEQTLRALQRSEAVKTAALRQLEENAKLLNQIIAALEKRRKEELARSRKKAAVLEARSQYCQPADGLVVSRYGMQYHATLGTSTRNLGIEIDAKPGAPVRAAVSGEVALITRIPGYGLGIILDNGSGFFTIYANLSGIRVGLGDKVKTCQEMAAVATEPGKVYFEVRKGTSTLDPQAWLKGDAK